MLNLDYLLVSTIKHEQTQQQQKIKNQNLCQGNKSVRKLLYLAYLRIQSHLKEATVAFIVHCELLQHGAAPAVHAVPVSY